MLKRAIAYRVLLFTICIATATAAPAPAPAPIKLSVDRPDGVFKSGETATFTVEAAGATPAAALNGQYELIQDGVKTIGSGPVALQGEPVKITAKLDQPGAVMLNIRLGGAPKPLSIGAIFDPYQIKPGMPAPADFDDFWNKEKASLAGDYKAEVTPVPSNSPDIDKFHVKIPMPEGRPVQGYLTKPHGAAPKSLGAIALTHGAGVRSSTDPSGWSSPRLGMMAFNFNAHGIDDGQSPEFYANLDKGELKSYRTDGIQSRDTVYFRGMYKRLLRAIDFLTKQPEWDGKTLVVYGGSQGGAQALVAAALDGRVTCIVAAYPALSDLTGFKAGRANGWPQPVRPGPDGKYDEKAFEAVRYYDCANFAARVKADTFIMEGLIDTTCCPTSVLAAFNAVPAQNKTIYIVPDKPHNFMFGKDGKVAEKFVTDHVAKIKGAAAQK